MKRYGIISLLSLLVMTACQDYLDIVPDNVATIDNAFTNRNEAEKFLFTCYSYLPQESYVYENPALLGGDELWTYWPITGLSRLPSLPQQIARGNQGIVDPYLNYWDGWQAGKPLFRALRDCNIFLEKVDQVVDLDPFMKDRWVAEVTFLKAYYHFYLMRMYGPIPIVDKNIPISASKEEVRVFRRPVDEVTDYIISLIDAAAPQLPDIIQNRASELGHITKPIALAIKARILVTMASPLYNGNRDYASLTNKDGTKLFAEQESDAKWTRALQACEEAIAACDVANIKLFKFNSNLVDINERLRQEMDLRNSIAEPWNEEVIWGFTNGTGSGIQWQAMPRLNPAYSSNETTTGQLAPTLKIVENFYTRRGLPINQDRTWDYNGRYDLKTADIEEQDYLQQGYTTVALHMQREPRFYASLAFDGSLWYMQNGTWTVQAKAGQAQSRKSAFGYSITGYFPKKLVNWKFVIQAGQAISVEQYPWPVIRLADLYLLHAEAANEVHGSTDVAFEYLDRVRERAGIPKLREAWSQYARNPEFIQTKEGLREIIHQERMNELAFEGHRFWDLRRWKEASEEMNKPVYGWDIDQELAGNYYRRKLLYSQRFTAPRDYLWPISEYSMVVNPNLVQNPGW
ncbi:MULTISPECIES: RagB/SusD family nutrient uptake outer membrane protein [Sphingobacterium]|uniref:RagB/SusD family nutrient uptake outer membrane protein n=1 Tax=Sphingobacterium populi TaxID=1812824 RepID=A0ABW5UEA0_9SPHI|nr:RagB/SusD family nutrient uptake outer membrane protein [Sphingobacterium sp. CFCC 11742]